MNRSYLKRFASADGFLTRVDLPGDRRPVPLSHATVIKNFYVMTLPDGSETDLAENVFGVIESAATEAIRILIEERPWPIPPEVRQHVAGWAALQHLRGPSVRQLGREIAEGLSAVGIPVRNEAGGEVRMRLPADQIETLSGPALQLALIRRQLPAVARMLYERDWIITDYQRKSLATSDTPIVLFPVDQPGVHDVGIANCDVIYVPLDRQAGLVITTPRRGDRPVQGTARSARIANSAMAKNARKYLFHHPDDDPLQGLELPKPRSRELADPGDAAMLIEDVRRAGDTARPPGAEDLDS